MDAPGPGSRPARTAAWVDSATTSQEPEPEAEGEDMDQDLLRRVFKAWRTAAVNQHARRVHSNQNEVPLHESEQLLMSSCCRGSKDGGHHYHYHVCMQATQSKVQE